MVSKYAKIDPKDSTCCPNFQRRFCPSLLTACSFLAEMTGKFGGLLVPRLKVKLVSLASYSWLHPYVVCMQSNLNVEQSIVKG